MRRKLKKEIPRVLGFVFLFLLVFMAYGYGALKTELNIEGKTEVSPKEEWEPKLKIIKISQIENVFFYEIDIENNSKLTCYDWEVEIEENSNISFPFGINAEKVGDVWKIESKGWDSRIEAKGKIIFDITFMVEKNLENSMTTEEYADFFVKNCIKLIVNMDAEARRDGKIIQNGKASLTLNENEREIKDYILEENINFVPNSEKEKQFILTIYNRTEQDYSEIRANIYFGNAKLIDISPTEILSICSDNATFQVPAVIELHDEKAVSVYITVNSNDMNFVPEVVVAVS